MGGTVTAPIPMVDLTRQYGELEEDISSAVLGVLSGGGYILGSEVESFEREMAGYLGVGHAVGVGSGTDALFLILKALGIGPGDEVITTPFTFIATADTVANCGAIPVFADIEAGSFNLDPEKARPCMNERTAAILVVHLFGHPADMGPFSEMAKEHDLFLVEDCAQSLGALYGGRQTGTIGNAGALSFFPTKNLGCAGDGGMVCTDDEALAERVRMLRAHGSRRKYQHEILGVNSRLDAIQAAILRVKLGRLDAWNECRREIAKAYDESLTSVVTPTVAPDVTHVYHQYTVRSSRRDALIEHLGKERVGSSVYYPLPLHLQPCFSSLGYSRGDFPASERAADEVLSLPVFPGMRGEEIERVCEVIDSAWPGSVDE